MKRLFGYLCALAIAAPVFAAGRATVLVPKEGDYWAVRDLSFMPRDKSDEGVSIGAINAWLNRNRGMKSESNLCYMNFINDRDIVSFDRKTQEQIDSDLTKFPNSFRQIYEPEPGKVFLVRVGVFADCDDPKSAAEPLSFMAVVITDQSGAIKNFDALEWEFIRLLKRSDGKINVFGCFYCGEVQELLWDKFNDRFYYNWVGH